MDLSTLATAVQRRRLALPAHRSALVGISGIDGAGKGFVAVSALSLNASGSDLLC